MMCGIFAITSYLANPATHCSRVQCAVFWKAYLCYIESVIKESRASLACLYKKFRSILQATIHKC